MNPTLIRAQIINFFFLLIVQIPLIHRAVLFEVAYGFFYVGFLLLLPVRMSRLWLMVIGFSVGIIIDVFTNTLGIHALACVFVLFIRNFWLRLIVDDLEELQAINIRTLGIPAFLAYVSVLVFIHHLLIFSIENGGFLFFDRLISVVVSSTLFSLLILFLVSYLSMGKKQGT